MKADICPLAVAARIAGPMPTTKSLRKCDTSSIIKPLIASRNRQRRDVRGAGRADFDSGNDLRSVSQAERDDRRANQKPSHESRAPVVRLFRGVATANREGGGAPMRVRQTKGRRRRAAARGSKTCRLSSPGSGSGACGRRRFESTRPEPKQTCAAFAAERRADAVWSTERHRRWKTTNRVDRGAARFDWRGSIYRTGIESA